MKQVVKAVILSAGVLTLTATASSAAIVCNNDGDCWRVRGRPHYDEGLRLRLYSDDWRWRRGEHYRWRNHGRGHGYYRDGVWVEIR
jgi:hypothetical protein